MVSAIARDLDANDLTTELAARAAATSLDNTPPEALAVARQCVLDWIGVTLAGATEPLVDKLAAVAEFEGGHPQAQLLGREPRVSVRQAALVNGAASHALDFDDVNSALGGHPSVVVLPALLAYAELEHVSGRALLEGFLAGYDVGCRVGRLVAPSHYARGHHSTATVGGLAAASGIARMFGADAETVGNALGIAVTQAAGLKSMFGTMCKPFHAGKACENGVLAYELATRGFSTNPNAIETAQGFAHTLSDDCNMDAARSEAKLGHHIRSNLFKYHASCYQTHAPIEAARSLRSTHEFALDDIDHMTLHIIAGALSVCNIQAPSTGLEAKFSLRHTVALALAGEPTGKLETFSDALAQRSDLVRLRDRVTVIGDDDMPSNVAKLTLTMRSGQVHECRFDASQPASDVTEQQQRVDEKFFQLAIPVLGETRANEIYALTADLASLSDVAELARLTRVA